LRVELSGAVATITLCTPQRRNSQTPHTWAALSRVADLLASNIGEHVRVVVLRGDGPAFSAGLDRSVFGSTGSPDAPGMLTLAAGPAEQTSAHIAVWQRAFDWTSRPDLVSIAAVQGFAVGAGFQLALGADIRIVADDAVFVMAEPALGLVPDLGGTKRLVDLVGYSRAAEICLTGRRVGAEEALRIGLASAVVPSADLETATAETVAALLAVGPAASAATKRLLLDAGARTQDEQERAEREAQYVRLRALVQRDADG
jgi:enoyl-CoA hydratase/carnithine racemase